jgi:hypothetical protein
MAINNIVPFDRGPSALVRSRRSNLNSNAQQGVMPSFAVVTYKGKNWRVKYRSEETVIRDERKQPCTSIEVVIVGISPAISRQYFANSYSEGSSDGPDCFSSDGIKPDASAPHKQNPTCATCPRGQWGSRITDGGKRAKECQDTRRIAVVPLNDIENKLFGGPMLLRIPPMSINNLGQYTQFLDRKGASVETVATLIGFDVDMAYPRLTFEALGYLSDAQQRLVIGDDGNSGVCADPIINRMLATAEEVWTPPRLASDVPPEPKPEPAEEYGPPMPPHVEPDEPEEEDEDVEPPPPVDPPAARTLAAPTRGKPKAKTNGKSAAMTSALGGAAITEEEMESALDDLLGDNTAA